jgi:hypothetical protein
MLAFYLRQLQICCADLHIQRSSENRLSLSLSERNSSKTGNYEKTMHSSEMQGLVFLICDAEVPVKDSINIRINK